MTFANFIPGLSQKIYAKVFVRWSNFMLGILVKKNRESSFHSYHLQVSENVLKNILKNGKLRSTVALGMSVKEISIYLSGLFNQGKGIVTLQKWKFKTCKFFWNVCIDWAESIVNKIWSILFFYFFAMIFFFLQIKYLCYFISTKHLALTLK